METIEVVIYTFVAIIVGAMTIYFIGGWNYTDFYHKLSGKDDLAFDKIDNLTFAAKAILFWKDCGLGATEEEATFYVTGDVPLDKEKLFDIVSKLNMCNTLQSAAYNCGNKEHVVFPAQIELPHVVRLKCDPVDEQLIISG